MTDREVIDAARAAELDYCAGNLLYFVAAYCHIEDKDAAEIIQPFTLWPGQKDALTSIRDHKLNIILKARQLGVTWLVLAYAVWRMLRPGFLVLALSRTEEEAKELVRRVGVILRYMPELMREDAKDGWRGIRWRCTALMVEIIHPGGQASTFKAFPSASGAGRSFTANLLLLDEWAFQASAREIWLSAYPTINRPGGGQVVGLSTIERGTLFEELWTGDNDFNKLFLPWDTDPRRTPEWYEATRRAMGDLIMQEYPATPEEALTIPGGAFFPEFSRHVHVAPPEDLEGSRRYVCLDYGLDMLSAHWVAYLPDGRAIVYREYDAPDLTIDAACKELLARNDNEDIFAWLAPPDLWGRDQITGRSRAERFADNGITLTKTSNDLEAGCEAIKGWLAGGLRITEGAAPNLCRCLTKIQRDKNRPNVYAKQPHDLTHDVDSLRCFCVYWTYPVTLEPVPTAQWTPDMWEDYDRASEEERAYLKQKWGQPAG